MPPFFVRLVLFVCHFLYLAGADPVPDMASGSFVNFPHHCGIRDLLAFLIQSPVDFNDTDADKVMNPQHFGSDSSDIHI